MHRELLFIHMMSNYYQLPIRLTIVTLLKTLLLINYCMTILSCCLKYHFTNMTLTFNLS